ncbi:hypothetical protein NM271_2143 [Neisseria meningitidis NM271]|nr:hypothetical protein [Neisseria meningitidis]EOC55222.1 hypothetical protein NM271_2143 [Neisseria meningitidis NM271]EOC68016.1 hypothetical protein NM3144_2140 [Neisseria meningitidis NM3144]MCW0500899.1 hypothetical protein [Neisseria meningitidis]
MNQQGGFQFGGGCIAQSLQFFVQVFQKTVKVFGFADRDADKVFNVGGFGKGTQVQTDDGFFQPLSGVFGNSIFIFGSIDIHYCHVNVFADCTCGKIGKGTIPSAGG